MKRQQQQQQQRQSENTVNVFFLKIEEGGGVDHTLLNENKNYWEIHGVNAFEQDILARHTAILFSFHCNRIFATGSSVSGA